MKIGEVLGAGLWAASAVQVTKYTYNAMTGQYVSFPNAADGSGGGKSDVNHQAGPILSKLPGGDFGYNWLQGARHYLLHNNSGIPKSARKGEANRVSPGMPLR